MCSTFFVNRSDASTMGAWTTNSTA